MRVAEHSGKERRIGFNLFGLNWVENADMSNVKMGKIPFAESRRVPKLCLTAWGKVTASKVKSEKNSWWENLLIITVYFPICS